MQNNTYDKTQGTITGIGRAMSLGRNLSCGVLGILDDGVTLGDGYAALNASAAATIASVLAVRGFLLNSSCHYVVKATNFFLLR